MFTTLELPDEENFENIIHPLERQRLVSKSMNIHHLSSIPFGMLQREIGDVSSSELTSEITLGRLENAEYFE